MFVLIPVLTKNCRVLKAPWTELDLIQTGSSFTLTQGLGKDWKQAATTYGEHHELLYVRCTLLRRMMSLARRTGKLAQTPYFPMLKEGNVRKGFLTPSQFIKLGKTMPEDLRPLMTFLYFTGCRIGAALAISWSQIESENGRFQLRIEGNQRKNEEPILLPLPLELSEILKRLPRKGKLFDARNLRKSFQAACVKVGLGRETGPEVWQCKDLLPHDFRRSGVRNLIRSGVPRRIAMKISGHLTESTLERYNIGTTSWTRRICTRRWPR